MITGTKQLEDQLKLIEEILVRRGRLPNAQRPSGLGFGAFQPTLFQSFVHGPTFLPYFNLRTLYGTVDANPMACPWPPW